MSTLRLNITIELLDDRQLGIEPNDEWERARADLLRGLDAARATFAAQPLPMNPFDGPPWPELCDVPGLGVHVLLDHGPSPAAADDKTNA